MATRGPLSGCVPLSSSKNESSPNKHLPMRGKPGEIYIFPFVQVLCGPYGVQRVLATPYASPACCGMTDAKGAFMFTMVA